MTLKLEDKQLNPDKNLKILIGVLYCAMYAQSKFLFDATMRQTVCRGPPPTVVRILRIRPRSDR